MFEFLASGQLCLKLKFFHKKKQVTVGLFFYNTWRQYLFIWLFFSVLFCVFLFVCVFFLLFSIVHIVSIVDVFSNCLFALLFFLSPVSNNFKFHIWEHLTHLHVKLARMFLFYQKRVCVCVCEWERNPQFIPAVRARTLFAPFSVSFSSDFFFFVRNRVFASVFLFRFQRHVCIFFPQFHYFVY